MANNFTGEPSLVALYRGESVITSGTDSAQTNDLTWNSAGGAGPPGVSSDKQEGVNSLFLAIGSQATYTSWAGLLDDADMTSDFPGKDGETNTDFTFLFWWKYDWQTIINMGAGNFNFTIIGKVFGATDAWRVSLDDATDKGPGGSFQCVVTLNNVTKTYPVRLTEGTWYHIAFAVKAVEGGTSTFRIRIWDDNADSLLSTDMTGTFADQLAATNVNFRMGSQLLSGGLANTYLDEVVILGRILTVDEIDSIRLGLFGLQPLPSFPSGRPIAYDPDLIWVPGEWTDPSTYVSPEWGEPSRYFATGGGKWGQQLVVVGNGKVYYTELD